MRINDRANRKNEWQSRKACNVFRINRPVHVAGLFPLSETLKEQLQAIEQSGSPCVKRMICALDDDL